MDAARIVLDIYDAFVKAYSAILGKQYVSVKVQLVPQKDTFDQDDKKLIAFTIINESGPEIEIQEAWFLTSFNRRVFSEVLNSRMPVRIRSRDREIYFLPAEDLKAALNEKVGETIAQAAVFDNAQRKYSGRVDRLAELEFTR